ncbi:crotonase/enoyl-CoA hydratase family protein [Hoeflea prorocentri]|uniref:Crotonase/enoyl-CoA hydratase family protein n=1 Tax=Hoeflea prorocentri TaxID=1922333 RepID=A0A9X3UHW2_9HYPH|nr:crotonase/enoyl-CoA hydratase family protein [Hoeflea prorocentri]MCY6381693.1 crotonase/enoyl-CoA hydratase family protein [Hoeflea prorocentri]MDA5399493.1 crotonase/enoyl-CoA hydratase family protein [Hoeflea prorocentri]
MSEHIIVERPENLAAVQVIRFNRPDKKNAITQDMYRLMVEAMRAGDEDDAVRAHVFLGTEGCFTAGNDMQDFLSYAVNGRIGEGHVGQFLKALATVKKPMISGVDGLAIGIGTTVHFHCDLTFASPRSEFRTPFVDLALLPEAGSSLLGPMTMGHQRAFAMLAAGVGFSAEEARDAGLIYKVVPEAELESATLAAAAEIASKPPQAMQIARDLLRRGDRADIVARIEEESALFGERLASPEAKAAFEAFLARKKSA